MAKNNKMPAIRFSGYTDAWEQRKLDDIAKIKTGGGTPKTANPEYWSGNIPWIQSSDLVEGDIVHVNINKFINNNALKNSAAKLISRDSIALVTRVGVGKVAVINQDFTTSQDFLSLSDFDGNDIKFLAYQLYRLMQENAKVLQGTSIKGITKTELIEQSISIPSSGQEQNLISNVLSKIDSIITLHQRKLGKLKLTKTALLQKLFPQNGSKFPELRFQGFTDAWEQRKLGDLMEVTSVKRIHQADWTDSGIRFFRARDIVSSMNNEEIDNPVFISEDKYEEYSRVSGKVVEGDLLVTGVGTIGVPYLIKDTTPLYFKDGNIIWFKNNNTLNGRYFYYCFQNGHIQNQIYSASGKGTVGTYTIENGKKTSIFYPSLNEQIKIGNLLDTMTIMITLYQRKLEMLKNVKKGLLQKMFV